MRTVTVKCDECEQDISDPRYRLAMLSEGLLQPDPNNCPSLADIHHFCGLKCLGQWVKNVQRATEVLTGLEEKKS